MAQALATRGFRGPQVCKIVGISYRQLDYWARTELAMPSIQPAQGSGSQRLYSFEDLVELKLIKKLLDAGVSLHRVRGAIDYLRGLGQDLSGVTLVSDGVSIYACHSDNEVVDVLRRGQGVFGIAIDPVIQGLRGSVSELRPLDGADEQNDRGSSDDASEDPAAARPLRLAAPGGRARGEE
ncbi:MAG TPA: MerR family transcriptional regulator [Actinomycetota bacterium]|nr:MerR family transcriptional regulator [Actinomycetota bacterium]